MTPIYQSIVIGVTWAVIVAAIYLGVSMIHNSVKPKDWPKDHRGNASAGIASVTILAALVVMGFWLYHLAGLSQSDYEIQLLEIIQNQDAEIESMAKELKGSEEYIDILEFSHTMRETR